MSLVPQSIAATFSHSLLQVRKRTVILARCLKCGRQKVCSTWDGSLQRWERSHQCGKSEVQTGPPVVQP